MMVDIVTKLVESLKKLPFGVISFDIGPGFDSPWERISG